MRYSGTVTFCLLFKAELPIVILVAWIDSSLACLPWSMGRSPWVCVGLLAIVGAILDTAVLVDSISLQSQLSSVHVLVTTRRSCHGAVCKVTSTFMRSCPGSGYCFLGPRSPTTRLVIPWDFELFLSTAEICGVIRSGEQERRCYGHRLHPAILYCSNLDSASPSRPPIESQAIYYSLESEQQQDHVDVGKR